MARKPKSARVPRPRGGKNNLYLVAVAVVLLIAGAGLAARHFSGGAAEAPPPVTASGKLVVMEFSDYG